MPRSAWTAGRSSRRESGDLFYWTAATVLLNGGLFEVNAEFSALEALDDATWHDSTEHYYAFADRRYAVDPAKADYLGQVAAHAPRPGAAVPQPGSDGPAAGRRGSPGRARLLRLQHGDRRATVRDPWPDGRPCGDRPGWQHDGRTIALVANLVDDPQEVRIAGEATLLAPREIRVIGA